MTYQAVVSKITVFPHPNADRLQIANALGYSFIVGLDAKTDDVYVIFADDGKLSPEFCKANDLYPRFEKDGTRAGGYFTEGKERVRAQRFRGVKSEAFGMPLESLAFTGHDLSKLKEGDMFDTLNGVKICEKYFTPATLRAMKNGTGPKPKARIMVFPEHTDTTQWRFAYNLPLGSLIVITEKLHGTSVRVANTKVTRPLKWWQKPLNKFLGIDFAKYEYVLGTRRTVVKADGDTELRSSGYYANDGVGQPYVLALEELRGKLDEDYQVFGELVGYLPTGRALFTHSTEDDKEAKQRYGKVIDYSYGNPVGQCSFYVYRVTVKGRDLSWFQMNEFCKLRNLKVVPKIGMFLYDGNKEALDEFLLNSSEGPSILDDRHIKEGDCVLVESEQGSKIYKYKSFTFRLFEGLEKNKDTYVDMEEAA